MSSPRTVSVVLDREFSDSLESLVSSRAAVWIAGTPANCRGVERIRVLAGEHELTTFQVRADFSPEDMLFAILPIIELHHGDCSQQPPFDSLLVIGAPPSDAIRRALRELGFAIAGISQDGFEAVRTDVGDW